MVVKTEQIGIDNKDRKILSLLDFNARMSNSEIAKKLRLNKEVIRYRIRNLEQKGIIKQYYAIINPSKLGYYYFRIGARLQNITKKEKETIFDWLRKNKKIAYFSFCEGSYDVAIGYWGRNIFEFEKFTDNFNSRFSKYISEKTLSVGTMVWQMPLKFLNKSDSNLNLVMITGGKTEKEKLDEKDKKILVELTKNCRQNYEEMGLKVGLTGKAVKYRVKELLRKGIIVGFRSWIDYSKFGYTNTKVFLNLKNIDKEKIKNFVRFLINHERIIYITKAVGSFDLEFEILTKNRKEFYKTLEEIREKNKEIISYYSSLDLIDERISRFVPID